LTVYHCYSVHLLCFLEFRHRTRFHDSFCLASVHVLNVCLLIYLLTIVRSLDIFAYIFGRKNVTGFIVADFY